MNLQEDVHLTVSTAYHQQLKVLDILAWIELKDLKNLIDARVAQIKFIDRTFNAKKKPLWI